MLQAWEGRAYEYGMNNLRAMGYPVDGLKFDPDLVRNLLWIVLQEVSLSLSPFVYVYSSCRKNVLGSLLVRLSELLSTCTLTTYLVSK